MLIFPQLSSGANVQYPLARVDARRTAVNVMADGSILKFEDVAGARAEWALRLDSLNDAERLAIEQLYLATEGQLRTFTLLDPVTNLLSWSEDFSKPAWVGDPLLQKTGGGADPFGGASAWQLTNSAQALQAISQTIAGPGGFEYCFSAYVKGTGTVYLTRKSGSLSETEQIVGSGGWQRVSTAGRLDSLGATFQVSIGVEGGATLEVFGPQLEAQPAAGPYRRNAGLSGVTNVRFDSSQLSTDAVGLDRFSSVIRLVSVE